MCLLTRLLKITTTHHIDEAMMRDAAGLSPDLAAVFTVGFKRLHKIFAEKTDLEFDNFVADLHETKKEMNPLIRSRMGEVWEAVIGWVWGS